MNVTFLRGGLAEDTRLPDPRSKASLTGHFSIFPKEPIPERKYSLLQVRSPVRRKTSLAYLEAPLRHTESLDRKSPPKGLSYK